MTAIVGGIKGQALIRTIRQSEGVGVFRDTGDDAIVYEALINGNTGLVFAFDIHSSDGTFPTGHTGFANNAAVPIGSYWTCHGVGSNVDADDFIWKKTAASTWTPIAPGT